MATKTASKTVKTSKSKTPLLDAAKAANPHKGPDGWNKDAAAVLLTEALTTIAPGMAASEVGNVLAVYGPLAGWKNLAKAIAKKLTGTEVKD